MKRTKAFIAALSALCVTFSAMVSVSAADELQDTTGGQPEGAVVQNNELTMENAGACIGNTPYLNWLVAMGEIKPGDTVTLLQDYKLENSAFSPIVLMALFYGEVTLDLNGHTIDLGNSYISIQENMKIIDRSAGKAGKIIANHRVIEVGPIYDATLDGVTVTSENNPVIKDDPDKGIYYGTIISQGNLTINDSTVTGGYEAIEIDGGKVTINGNSTIEGNGDDAIYIHDPGAELTINSGTINGTGNFAIVGNGTNTTTDYRGDTKININGGNVIAEHGTAIYLPQYGEVKIEEGSITGDETAIEIESGKLNIIGGNFTAKSDAFGINTDHPSGSIASGSAIAVVCRTDTDKNHEGSGGYYGNMDINISGGTFNGVCGIAKYLVDGKDEADSINNMSITGGTFTGTKCAVSVDEFCKDNKFISGGTFNTDVTSYLADGTAYSSDNGEYTVYSAANKITGAGTYKTALNEDNKYDQLTMEAKKIEGSLDAKNISFSVVIGSDQPKTYNYTGNTTFTNATVLFGLIVTDIPAGETVTVDLQ